MALEYDQWPTLLLYCLLDILPLFDKGHNNGLLELLFNDIFAKRCNDIPNEKDCMLVPRFQCYQIYERRTCVKNCYLTKFSFHR